MGSLLREPRRPAMALGSGLALVAVLVLGVMALTGVYRAEAHQDPPDCTVIGLGGSVSNPLGFVAHGDVVDYTVQVANPAGNCNVTDLDLDLFLPDGSTIPVLSDEILDNGDSITCPGDPECLGPVTYSYAVAHVDENGGSSGCPPVLAPGNTQITAYAVGIGTGHAIIHDDATVCQAKSNPIEHDTDLKKVDFWAEGPSQLDVSQNGTVALHAVLHNNGPIGPAAATDTITARAITPGCTVTPESAEAQVELPVSQAVPVDAEFTIHCSETSTHEFEFCDEVTLKDPTLEDPDLGNNQRCITYSVDAIGEADVQIVSFECADPGRIEASENVVVECTKVLHNDGPVEVEVQVNKTAEALIPGCEITPVTDAEQVILTPSVEVAHVEEFTIHCSEPSFHDFLVTNCVDPPKDPHVDDPNLDNNCAAAQFGGEVLGEADVKVLGVDCVVPPRIDVSENAVVTCTKILHNNGPEPASVTLNWEAVGVDDCEITPVTLSEQVDLPPSVLVDVVEEFTIHCTEPSLHHFEVLNCAGPPKDPHVDDPDLGNNCGRAEFETEVWTAAELKILDFSCNAPLEMTVSEDVVVQCTKVLHNNGPYGPVPAQVTKTASCSPSPECSITPDSVSELVELPVSQSVDLVEEFTLHCFSPGTYEFTLTNEVDAAEEITHVVVDPDRAETRFEVNCPGAEGCTPGYWKNNMPGWGPTGFSTMDPFELVFGTAPEPFPTNKVRIDNPTLLEVLGARGGGINALSRHAVAALLNSAHPDIGYGMSPAAVIAAYQAALLSGDEDVIEAQKNVFAEFNEAGCPIDAHGRVIEDD